MLYVVALNSLCVQVSLDRFTSVYTSDLQAASEVTFDPSASAELAGDMTCTATMSDVEELDVLKPNVCKWKEQDEANIYVVGIWQYFL